MHVIKKCSLHAATVWKDNRYHTVNWLKYCRFIWQWFHQETHPQFAAQPQDVCFRHVLGFDNLHWIIFNKFKKNKLSKIHPQIFIWLVFTFRFISDWSVCSPLLTPTFHLYVNLLGVQNLTSASITCKWETGEFSGEILSRRISSE